MEFKDKKAIYLQIAEYLMDEILQGKYLEGERMPSVRECAADVEVNVNTLVRTYDWLCQQDIIFTKRGLGYFVSEGSKKHIKGVRRKEFFEETLPEVVRQMQTLGIGVEEVMRELREGSEE